MRPRLITDALLKRSPLPDPSEGGSKEHRGRALIIAGADEMPGAGVLAATAALRVGCGKVRVATADTVATAVAIAVPEIFVLPIAAGGKQRGVSLRAVIDSAKKTDAVVIGPGMRDGAAIRRLLDELVRLDSLRALVIDATALPIFSSAKFSDRRCAVVLTPHRAEAAALLNVSAEKIDADPLGSAGEIAQAFEATVVLKGAETLVYKAGGDHHVYANRRGNIGLATAGSGDVLAGIIGGLAARGADAVPAAVWAVALHARAGERLARSVGPLGYLARELPGEIPALLGSLANR
jgi:ADP-dependent NAD(P)H-hydrate dehydratase